MSSREQNMMRRRSWLYLLVISLLLLILIPAAGLMAQEGTPAAPGIPNVDPSNASEIQADPPAEDGPTVPVAREGAGSDDVSLAASTFKLYTSRATFNADWPALPTETFEEGTLAGNIQECPAPLDRSNNDACFKPGDILAGIKFQDNPGPSNPGLGLVGVGWGNAVSKSIVQWWGGETFDIFFTSDTVFVAGMDLISINSSATLNISVYGPGNTLLATTTSFATGEGVFWGLSSDVNITRINLTSQTGTFEGVDNISFGSKLKTYTTRNDFNNYWPNLPIEDFEDGIVGDNSLISCIPPLNFTTADPLCYPVGKILKNISFTNLPPLNGGIVLVGKGTNSSLSKYLIANYFNPLEISFTGLDPLAVGLDLMVYGGTGPADTTVTVYDTGGTMIDLTTKQSTNSGNFFGIASDRRIGRITLQGVNRWVGADNIAFGGKFRIFNPMVFNNYWGGPWEIEPNDSPSAANGPLQLGKNYFGSPDDKWPGEERDWFYFNYGGTGNITVDVTNFIPDAQVLMFKDPNYGTILDSQANQPGGNYQLFYNGSAGAGKYMIWLFAPANHPKNHGDYTVKVTVN